MLSMYLVAGFAAAWAWVRWTRRGTACLRRRRTSPASRRASSSGCGPTRCPSSTTPATSPSGCCCVAAVVLETALWRRGETSSVFRHGVVALAAMLVAFTIWLLSNAGWCDPDSAAPGPRRLAPAVRRGGVLAVPALRLRARAAALRRAPDHPSRVGNATSGPIRPRRQHAECPWSHQPGHRSRRAAGGAASLNAQRHLNGVRMFGKAVVTDMINRSAENETDRRLFLKSAGVAGLGVVGAGALGGDRRSARPRPLASATAPSSTSPSTSSTSRRSSTSTPPSATGLGRQADLGQGQEGWGEGRPSGHLRHPRDPQVRRGDRQGRARPRAASCARRSAAPRWRVPPSTSRRASPLRRPRPA